MNTQLEGSMAASNKRRDSRHPIPGKIKLHWMTPEGGTVYLSAQCLDISKNGIRVKLERKVAPGLMVRVESSQFHIAGVAFVRHCQPQGMQFVAGIEFTGGLTWNEPQAE